MIDRIPLAGVIGSPVSHSLSPRLHGHWLKTNKVAGHYVPMDIAQDDLADVLRMLPRIGFVGVNVTIPHKERALALANLVTDRAALIGAANTLIFHKDGRIHADNTDGYGFLANLRQGAPGWDAAAGPAAVLGAGGAARAIVTALIDAGAPEGKVVPHRCAKQKDILHNKGHTAAQVRTAYVANVGAVDKNLAGRYIVKPFQEIDQRRFAGTGQTNNGYRFAVRYGKGDIL